MYMRTNDLVFSLIDNFLAQCDYFFPREPLNQMEISAHPESVLKGFSWASRAGTPSPLARLPRMPRSSLCLSCDVMLSLRRMSKSSFTELVVKKVSLR